MTFFNLRNLVLLVCLALATLVALWFGKQHILERRSAALAQRINEALKDTGSHAPLIPLLGVDERRISSVCILTPYTQLPATVESSGLRYYVDESSVEIVALEDSTHILE